jgi:hypothetical protein
MLDQQDSFRAGIYDHAEQRGRLAGMSDVEVMGAVSPVLPESISRVHVNRGTTEPGLENIEFEKTVRGSLHWIGVMRDWKWEGECKLTAIYDRKRLRS